MNFDYNMRRTRYEASGKKGIRSEVKVLVFLRILGTGKLFDDVEDSVKMGRQTIPHYFHRFFMESIHVYGGTYLNIRPTPSEIANVETKYSAVGFPGCQAWVDCCKLVWKHFPVSLKGKYHSSKDGKLATIQVETVPEKDIYVWHWFAGQCGTNNDKTTVSVSPLSSDILSGRYLFKHPDPYKTTPLLTALRVLSPSTLPTGSTLPGRLFCSLCTNRRGRERVATESGWQQ